MIKKLIFTLLIIALLPLVIPHLSALSQPSQVPHEDPSTATESPNPVLLLLFYGDVFDLVNAAQYQEAKSLLNTRQYANIPDEIRYLIERYDTLSSQLILSLDSIELYLNEASYLLSDYRLDEARDKLDNAESSISEVRITLDDLIMATAAFGDELGALALSASADVKEAFDRLTDLVSRLEHLLNELNRLLYNLSDTYDIRIQEDLIPTDLTLDITPITAFVGDSIVASGSLTCNGSPLADRMINLLLDDDPFSAYTGSDGSYSLVIDIPYRYVSTITLGSSFHPSGNDIGQYLPSQSPLVNLQVNYYTTTLEVSAPDTALPGLPINIYGQISSTGSGIYRQVKVFLDGEQLAVEMALDSFNINMTLPEQTPVGEHLLTITVTSMERYAPASSSLSIDISKLPIEADIKSPTFTTIPKEINISGLVYIDTGPIQDAQVSIVFKDTTVTVTTSSLGLFSATLDLPMELSLIGPQEFTVIIEPAEAYYSSLELTRWIFTVNPTSIGIMLVISFSMGLVIYKAIRPKKKRSDEVSSPYETKSTKPIEISQVTSRKHDFPGTRGKVYSAYFDSLESVEKATNIYLTDNTTLSEYRLIVRPEIEASFASFSDLTTLAEVAIYSIHRLDETTVQRAKELVMLVKKGLLW